MRLVASSDGPGIDDATRAEAQAWILAVSEDPAREPESLVWRSADPVHEAAWREANRLWQQSAQLGLLDRPDWRAEIEDLTRPTWRKPARWLVAATVALTLGVSLYARSLPDFRAETAIAETRKLALDDGSQVTLAAQSGVAVRFEGGSRRVVLDHGEVFFEVAHDSDRPFTVVAGDAEIRVTGTQFDVRKVGDDIRVSVLEGRVELRRKGMIPILTPDRAERVLTAGLSARLAAGAAGFTPEERAAIPAGGWRSGRLYYSDAPLSDIIADLQRYSASPVRIDDPAVARMKVTTSFRTGRTGSFIESLPASLPVRLNRLTDGTIVIEARDRGT